MLHLFLHMYNVTQPSSCLTKTVSTDGTQMLLTTDTRVGHSVWLISYNTGLVAGSVILNETILYPWSVHNIYCTQYCNCIIKSCYIT